MGSDTSRQKPQHNADSPQQPPSFEQIGDDATRLIMRSLDRADLIQLAQCSRRMIHAADAPPVWTHVTPIVYLPDSVLVPPSLSSAYSMLPYQPLHLRVSSNPVVGSSDSVAALLAKLAALQSNVTAKCGTSAQVHFAALDAQDTNLSQAELAALLSNPLAQQLRSVAVRSAPLAAVAALPHLAALHLSAPRLDAADLSAALASSRHLTSLHLVDGAHAPLLSVAASCRSLLHLSLFSPHHSGFLSFFTHPHIRSTLQSLQLDELDCASSSRQKVTRVPAAEYRAMFAALVCLRSVYLRRVFFCDLLLEPLACAPSLQSVVIETRGALLDRWGNWQDDTHPTVDTLRKLMQSRPALEVSLLLLEVAEKDGPLCDLREKLRLRYQQMEDELRASGCAGFRFCSTTEVRAAKLMPQFVLA